MWRIVNGIKGRLFYYCVIYFGIFEGMMHCYLKEDEEEND